MNETIRIIISDLLSKFSIKKFNVETYKICMFIYVQLSVWNRPYIGRAHARNSVRELRGSAGQDLTS